MNRILAAAASLCLTLDMAMAAGTQGAGGVLTLTFDDASHTQHDIGLPIATGFDMAGTIFVTSGFADHAARNPGDWAMNWRQVADFRDAGWEVGAHSDSHPKMTQLSDERLAIEIEVPHDEIAAHLGEAPVSFASPFGDYDDRTLAEIMRRYSYHAIAWGGNEGRNPLAGVDASRIGRMNVDVGVSVEEVCAEIERAAQEGLWLVLMFHGFEAVNPVEYQTEPAAFRRMLSCAARQREAGTLRIMPLRDAMAEMTELAGN